MTVVVISQPMLFPWRGMFEQIALADVYVHYDDVAFSKGSFTNRVQVKLPGGKKWMTTPLRRAPTGTPISALRASEGTNWRAAHIDMLRQSLREAPYADDALALARETYNADLPFPAFLMRGIESVADWLGITPARGFMKSSEMGIGGASSQRVAAIVAKLGGRRYVTGQGAAAYLDHELLEANGADVRYMDYRLAPYPQSHGAFDPYVTILDLIGHVGREAPDHLAPRTLDWRGYVARREGGAG